MMRWESHSNGRPGFSSLRVPCEYPVSTPRVPRDGSRIRTDGRAFQASECGVQVHQSAQPVLNQFYVDPRQLPVLLATRDRWATPLRFDGEIGFSPIALFLAEFLDGPPADVVRQLNTANFDAYFQERSPPAPPAQDPRWPSRSAAMHRRAWRCALAIMG